eukprot:PITA_04842
MNDVVRPFIDSFVIVYLDDILVSSATWEGNISHLMQVMETLMKHQLLANLKKCEFAQQSLVYLGYVVGGGELKIDPSKMEAIMKWSVPTNVTEAQNKLQQTRHYEWMGFSQKFHLVIKYKKGNINKFANMLSRPPTSMIIALGTLMHMDPFTHDAYRETYSEDEDFTEVYQQLQSQSHVHNDDNIVEYHLQDGLLYRLYKLCVPKGDHLQLIREAHSSKVAGHFGVGKTVANLHMYVY